MIDLECVPHRAALLAGQDNTLEVVLRAKAPAAPNTQRERLPLNLAIVIDRSGSMSGRPLAEAKRCADTFLRMMTAAALRLRQFWVGLATTVMPDFVEQLFDGYVHRHRERRRHAAPLRRLRL